MNIGLPDGEGVIDTKAGAGRVLSFYAALIGVGAAAAFGLTAFLGRAEAKPPLGVELKLEMLVKDIGDMKKDIVLIKCRLNIEGTCPPEIPVRASGVGR